VGLLTYGDPQFQGKKVQALLEQGQVDFAVLTYTRKGKALQEIMKQDTLRTLDPELDLSSGDYVIELYDDDPKMGKSFRDAAQSQGIPCSAVIRVRRSGVKRANDPTPEGSIEINVAEGENADMLFVNERFQRNYETSKNFVDYVLPEKVEDDPSVLGLLDPVAAQAYFDGKGKPSDIGVVEHKAAKYVTRENQENFLIGVRKQPREGDIESALEAIRRIQGETGSPVFTDLVQIASGDPRLGMSGDARVQIGNYLDYFHVYEDYSRSYESIARGIMWNADYVTAGIVDTPFGKVTVWQKSDKNLESELRRTRKEIELSNRKNNT
jgi:hypothetical protein